MDKLEALKLWTTIQVIVHISTLGPIITSNSVRITGCTQAAQDGPLPQTLLSTIGSATRTPENVMVQRLVERPWPTVLRGGIGSEG